MENDKLFDLMTKMYSEMHDMNAKMYSEMHDMNANLNTKIDSIDARVNSIELDVKETKSLQIRMEQTLNEKLSALFDGYKQNTDQLNRISEEVAKHEEVIIRRVK